MSWYSKVFWSEGLFLRPHHLQQNDRYVEHLLERRVGQVTPYPWGFSYLEIDRDLAQQSKFALRRGGGGLPGGTPLDIPRARPGASRLPSRFRTQPPRRLLGYRCRLQLQTPERSTTVKAKAPRVSS